MIAALIPDFGLVPALSTTFDAPILFQEFYGIVESCVTEIKKLERKSASLQILSAFGLMRSVQPLATVPELFRVMIDASMFRQLDISLSTLAS